MASNPPQQGGASPPKPWERTGGSSGPTPFKPPSPGNTSDVVEASGTAVPGEIVPSTNSAVNRNALSRPVPTRPWEQQQTSGGIYGGAGYGSGMNYNSGGYGSGMYGSTYGGGLGGLGSSYGGGMYGNSMYRGGGYGGSSMLGGGMYGGSSMLGGGMYGGGLGGTMGGGYGMGMGMGPYGDQDPNNPYGPPSSPPSFWISMLKVMQGVVTFFGRIAILIDQNTQAFHMFMSALLQLFDRSGMLYGELARFVLRLLGVKTKSRKVQMPGPDGLPVPHNPQNMIEGPGPKGAPSGAWDNVWGNEN